MTKYVTIGLRIRGKWAVSIIFLVALVSYDRAKHRFYDAKVRNLK